MDPAKKCLLVSVVVVVTLIIVAIAAKCACRKKHRRVPRRRERYEVGNPAAPRQHEAAGDLQAHLTVLVNLGKSFQGRVRSLGEEEMKGMEASWEGDPQVIIGVVGALTTTLDKARAAIKTTHPSYAGYYAIYKGLNGAGVSFASTAESLVAAGRALQQTIARNPTADPRGDLSDAGITLIKMGKQVRDLASSVHRFGASLDME